MKSKSIWFIVLGVLQIALLSFMLIKAYQFFNEDVTVKLSAKLYDPYNMMKGRFVQLDFPDLNPVDIKLVPFATKLEYGQEIYCILREKSYVNGFYALDSVNLEKPSSDKIFIKTEVRYKNKNSLFLTMEYKYYMQEDFAPKVEKYLTEDKSLNPYVVLAIDKNGNAVVKNFMVTYQGKEVSIEDFIQEKK